MLTFGINSNLIIKTFWIMFMQDELNFINRHLPGSHPGAFPFCKARTAEVSLALTECLTHPASNCPYRRTFGWSADGSYCCHHPHRQIIVEQTSKGS